MRKPKKRMVWILGIAILLGAARIPVFAQDQNPYAALLGEWDVQTTDGQYGFVFTFKMEEDVLTGNFNGPAGVVPMQKLTFEDNKLTFQVTIDAGGQAMLLDFATAIEGETLTGFVAVEFGEAEITGKKRK